MSGLLASVGVDTCSTVLTGFAFASTGQIRRLTWLQSSGSLRASKKRDEWDHRQTSTIHRTSFFSLAELMESTVVVCSGWSRSRSGPFVRTGSNVSLELLVFDERHDSTSVFPDVELTDFMVLPIAMPTTTTVHYHVVFFSCLTGRHYNCLRLDISLGCELEL